MARAMGCVDSRSRAAARDSSSAELVPKEGNGQMSVTAGRPTVRVPVLSKTTLSTLDAASKMSPPLISRPLDQKKWGGLSENAHMWLFLPMKQVKAWARTALSISLPDERPWSHMGTIGDCRPAFVKELIV